MANLTVKIINGEETYSTYSDGTFLPWSPVVTYDGQVVVLPDYEQPSSGNGRDGDEATENNQIIDVEVPFDCEEITLKALSDNENGIPLNDEGEDDDDKLQEEGSSYIVTTDSDWIKLIRERNITRLVFKRNYSESERVGNIIIKHNTEKEVYCAVTITQHGDVYTLSTDADENGIVFETIDGGDETVTVTCTGGTGEYVIHKIRKYIAYKIETSVGEIEVVKRASFDNAISVTKNPTNPNEITIHGNGSLSLDESYYEVILEHKDVIGLTATIKVSFPNYNAVDMLPDVYVDEKLVCAEEAVTPPPQIHHNDGDEITPSIELVDERDDDITINSYEYFAEIMVLTEPMESQIYFNYYGNFIDDVIITDYIDDNMQISHGIKIKAKPNPYSIDRHCVAFIINAMYPDVRLRINIHQDGNT